MNYFDHAASSPVYPEVLEVLSRTQREDFANPNALHVLGYALLEKIEEYRKQFLKTMGAKKNDQFIFTSSATESNNTVIRGLDFSEGDVVLYCKADHPSVTVPAENQKVILKEILLLKNGRIDTAHFTSMLDKNVKLVVLTHVNNQNGVTHPVAELSKLIKEKTAAHVHVDAVQSFGKIPFKLDVSIDSMSVTSHKIGGPKGIAGLFLKEGHRVRPLILGGNQEYGFRSSTQAFPLIAGFYEAMKISAAKSASVDEKIQMSEFIKSSLKKEIPAIQFPFEATSPFIVSMILPGISSDIVLRHLEARQVFISSTSACSSRVTGFNPGLAAMGIEEKFHKNFLRISFGLDTTNEEVENLTREFVSVWNDLKHMGVK